MRASPPTESKKADSKKAESQRAKSAEPESKDSEARTQRRRSDQPEGEKSVSELEALLNLRQPAVSQQLARLRADRLVETRREGQTIFYSLGSDQAHKVITVLYDLYCKDAADCP